MCVLFSVGFWSSRGLASWAGARPGTSPSTASVARSFFMGGPLAGKGVAYRTSMKVGGANLLNFPASPIFKKFKLNRQDAKDAKKTAEKEKKASGYSDAPAGEVAPVIFFSHVFLGV